MIGPAAHGAGIVEEKRHHRVAELGVALLFEGQRVHGIDDHAGKPRGVEHAFVEIEVPAAVLLGEQAPLKPIGKPGDGAVQRHQLLVEKGAQAVELVRVAQLLGGDDLVIGAGEHLVAEGLGVIEDGGVGAPGIGAPRQVGGLGIAVQLVGRAVLLVFECLLRRVVRLGTRLGGQLRAVLAFGALVLILGGVRIGFAVRGGFLVLVVLIELIGEIERGEHVTGEPAECLLVEQRLGHAVEQGAGALLDPGAPQIDQRARLGGRSEAGQPLAHEKRQRIGQRRFGALGLLGDAASRVALLHARLKIGGDPFHAVGADRLDAGLLDRLEYGARIAARRRKGLVQTFVMAGDREGRRIGMAADYGDLVPGRHA